MYVTYSVANVYTEIEIFAERNWNMQKIGIVGGGFSGIMTAIQLVRQADSAFDIILFEKENRMARGIAYSPISQKHILNVITAKMSAFPDVPEDFLNYVSTREEYRHEDREILANAFLPRYIYGDYLEQKWVEAKELAASKGIGIQEIWEEVTDIAIRDHQVEIQTADALYPCTQVVLATGNQLPTSLNLSKEVLESVLYCPNPWHPSAVSHVDSCREVVILGNGLTMVDTVISLIEKGFKGHIISLSPNGFNILPHRHNGMKYEELTPELQENMPLSALYSLVKKHVRHLRKLGVSAEPVIDSLRPYTQKIWKGLSEEDKALFMRRYRHLWGVARHRIPLPMHDMIQRLRIEKKLEIFAGKLQSVEQKEDKLILRFYNKKTKQEESILADRIINCTGPESNIARIKENDMLYQMLVRGEIVQDALALGIVADTSTFHVMDKKGNYHPHVFTLGSNLKGELWESTAVGELRQQAKLLAERLLTLS